MAAKKKDDEVKTTTETKTKSEVITPKVPKHEPEPKEEPRTKRSYIIHRTEKPAEDLYQLLAETEKSIADLSTTYAELPDSNHMGVGGKMIPTLKQEQIAKQLEQMQTRAERLTKLIENITP